MTPNESVMSRLPIPLAAGALLIAMSGCTGLVVVVGSTDAGPTDAGDGGVFSNDGGEGCTCPSTCRSDCDGVWYPIANRTLDFALTIASQCSDGGYAVISSSDNADAGSDGGDAGVPGFIERLEAIPAAACPASTSSDCAVTTVCSVNPDMTPLVAVYPAVFDIVGADPSLAAGLQRGNEAAMSFMVPTAGIPISIGLVMRRIGASTGPTGPADLLVDIVPTAQGVPSAESYIARARYNTGLLPYSTPGVDYYPTLTFETNFNSILSPGQTYALYIHIEFPGVDKVGLGGAEVSTNPSNVAFQQQFTLDGGPGN